MTRVIQVPELRKCNTQTTSPNRDPLKSNTKSLVMKTIIELSLLTPKISTVVSANHLLRNHPTERPIVPLSRLELHPTLEFRPLALPLTPTPPSTSLPRALHAPIHQLELLPSQIASLLAAARNYTARYYRRRKNRTRSCIRLPSYVRRIYATANMNGEARIRRVETCIPGRHGPTVGTGRGWQENLRTFTSVVNCATGLK